MPNLLAMETTLPKLLVTLPPPVPKVECSSAEAEPRFRASW
jgi:hypothetical protein